MISELLSQVTSTVETLSGGNQMIAGAVSLWLLGTLTWIMRSVPSTVWRFVKRNVVTSMSMNNGGWIEANTMTNFMCWLKPKLSSGMSRTLSVDTRNSWGSEEGDNKVGVSAGYGIHFFFFNKRLFWLNKTKIESSGSERQKEEITISTFGRSHTPFHNIVEEFKPKTNADELKMYKFCMSSRDWEMFTTCGKRDLKSVAMDSHVKCSVVDDIQHFKNNREWFMRSGLPYKLTYLLHGNPGGGKTSLVKGVASHFDMNVCIINVGGVSDSMLETALAKTPENSLVLIEDFDSCSASKSRKVVMGEESESEGFSPLTLAGFLNALDGAVPMDDCVLFLTTNHLEEIDEAVYRKGRVDHLLEITEVGDREIREYVNHIFPSCDLSELSFKPMMGCKLNEALLQSRDDSNRFLDRLAENGLLGGCYDSSS